MHYAYGSLTAPPLTAERQKQTRRKFCKVFDTFPVTLCSGSNRVAAGQRDTALSDHGRQQGKLVGQRLAASEIISHVYASDLVRAAEVGAVCVCVVLG